MTRAGVTNPAGWYNAAELEPYPLQEAAGNQVPSDLLVDLSIAGEADRLQAVWLVGLSCRNGEAAIVFEIVSSTGKTTQLTGKSTVPYSSVQLSGGDSDTVSGTVVFGAGIVAKHFIGDWSRGQLGVAMRCVFRRRAAQSRDLRFLGGATRLGGLSFSGAGDIEVRTQQGADGRTQQLLRLASSQDVAATHLRYLGDCGRRVESKSCEGNPAIERIASVEPDCEHTLELRFRDGLGIIPLADQCGVGVTYGLTVDKACRDSVEPDPTDLGEECYPGYPDYPAITE